MLRQWIVSRFHLGRAARLSVLIITVITFLFLVGLVLQSPLRLGAVFSAHGPQDLHAQPDLQGDSAESASTIENSKSSQDDALSHWDTLGIASRIFVVSLPHRSDRREQMEILRGALGLKWTYVDAVQAGDDVVKAIWNQVRTQRVESQQITAPSDAFHWPEHLDLISSSSESLGLAGSDLWSLSSLPSGSGATTNISLTHASVTESNTQPVPLTCATGNDTIPMYLPDLPDYKILTPAKIACWYSHLSVIRQIAEGDYAVAVVLEDDIDMERDIRERLTSVWKVLPVQWDIVFLGTPSSILMHSSDYFPAIAAEMYHGYCSRGCTHKIIIGHCWSNESHFAALTDNLTSTHTASSLSASSRSRTSIHPSFAPKCTHAYALTPTGARRLLLHLRYPPFAYSRAIDQAIAWLVESGRLRSYSVVPSVVVQRKAAGSDVVGGKGSRWKDELEKGVFTA